MQRRQSVQRSAEGLSHCVFIGLLTQHALPDPTQTTVTFKGVLIDIYEVNTFLIKGNYQIIEGF